MKTVVIIALFMALAGISLVESNTGYNLNLVKHGNKEYYFSGQRANWVEASKFCHLYGMQLVKIKDKSENDFIINNMILRNLNDAFTSGHRPDYTVDFTWGDGTYFHNSYTDWARNEPNYINRNKENCIMVRRNQGWHNIECHSKRFFVCEQSTPITPRYEMVKPRYETIKPKPPVTPQPWYYVTF